MTVTRPQIAVAVEDPDIREMLDELFTEEGYRVQLVARPARAAVFAAVSGDLIVLDCRLVPPMRGWRLLHALRAHPATQRVPVIALTADAAHVPVYRAQIEALSVRMCVLPFEIDTLLQLVREALAG